MLNLMHIVADPIWRANNFKAYKTIDACSPLCEVLLETHKYVCSCIQVSVDKVSNLYKGTALV